MDFMMEFLETLGTVAFSISGAIEAMKKQMDLLGVLVLGLVTAVGGGLMRVSSFVCWQHILSGICPGSGFPKAGRKCDEGKRFRKLTVAGMTYI